MVKFGVQHPCFKYDGVGNKIFETIKKRAQYAEENGFDSFWVMDHFMQIPSVGRLDDPILEAWTTLSALTQVTDKIKLGTLVTGNIYRNPALLAKMATTVDLISDGRLFLGVGAGWFETEATAYNLPFYTVSERLKRLDEALQIILGMWTTPTFSFQGRYYRIENALCTPKPVQKPHPPLLIGGGGEQVTLKLVAKYGDACNLFGGPQTVRKKFEKLKQHCETVGRDYGEILKSKLGHLIMGKDAQEVSLMVRNHRKPGLTDEQYEETVVYGTVEQVIDKVQEFIDAGVQYLIFNVDYPNEEKTLRLLAEKVITQF